MIGGELEVRDGRYTGFMARRRWWGRPAPRGCAATPPEGVDLKHSYAYADSYSDLPLLRAVGNPVAVSPDSALYRYARRRRWPIEKWAMSKGMPRVRFPKRRSDEARPEAVTAEALALEFFRSVPRYVAARAVGTKAPGLLAGPLAPLRLATPSDPAPPGRAAGPA